MKPLKYIILSFLVLIILFLLSQMVIAENKFELITPEEIKKLNDIFVEIERIWKKEIPSSEVVKKFYEEEKDLLKRLTSVFTAAEEGDFDVVRGFIEAGGNVNYPTPLLFQDPFITYAIGKNDLEMVKYLVEKGAYINDVTLIDSYKPKYLLDLKNLYIRNDVVTPLLLAIAIAYHHQSLDIAVYLRSKGAKFPVELDK